MISIITTGRDDDYEADFVSRMYWSLANNCDLLEKSGIEYEYIVTEWNPLPPESGKSWLYNHIRFAPLIQKYNITDLIIDKSLVEAEGLNPKAYYEYFAKNAGIRQAKYDNILVLNSDILLTQDLLNEIIETIKSPDFGQHFWRARNRGQIHMGEAEAFHVEDLHYPQFEDHVVCGAYSGDFLLATKQNIVDVGRGYDESCDDHRKGHQTGMDAEILWNMLDKGITLKFINSPYIHIYHTKTRSYANQYRLRATYENKPDWGFTSYPKEQIREKLIKIYHEKTEK